jgi:hypothetical protein
MRLRTHVHVRDEHGRSVVLAPGDDVPDWAAAAIRNPRAWQGGAAPSVETPTETNDTSAPPRSGAGSGKAEWAAYASTLGVTYPDGASRDDIIAAVDAAHTTE